MDCGRVRIQLAIQWFVLFRTRRNTEPGQLEGSCPAQVSGSNAIKDIL